HLHRNLLHKTSDIPAAAFGPVLLGRYGGSLDLSEGRHGPLGLAAASGTARPFFAALAFAVSSAGSGEAGKTLGAGPDAPVRGCGAALGRVASQSSRAIWIGSIRAVFHHSVSLRER